VIKESALHSSLPLPPFLPSQSPLISQNTHSVKNSAPGISMSLLDCKNSSNNRKVGAEGP